MKRFLVIIWLLLFACFFLAWKSMGATNYVHDLSLTNVQAQINAATTGDWVVLTNGTVGWTNTVTITNGITIAALTNSATTITNLQSDSDYPIFKYEPSVANLNARITGIYFTCTNGGLGIGVKINASTNFPSIIRIDHCTFDAFYGGSARAIYVTGGLCYGVVDHCMFVNNEKSVDVYAGLGSYANYSWSLPVDYGSTNAYFIEDNIFLCNADVGSSKGITSGGHGGRYVFRNNVVSNTAPGISLDSMDAHGNGYPVTNNIGIYRGTVMAMIYSNIFYSAAGYRHIHIRGGSGLIYSNVMNAGAMEKSIFFTEEDGPARFNYTTNYPGYDPVTNCYVWDNTYGGATAVPYVGSTSTDYIQQDRDYFLYAKPDYTAPIYPHPLVGEAEQEEPPDPPEPPEDPPDPGYSYASTAFNGSNQYMQNTNEFVAQITNSFTVSFWVRRNGGAGTAQYIYLARDSTQSRFTVQLTTGNKVTITGRNAASSTVLTAISGTSLTVGTNWYHIYASIDLSDTNNRCLVINGSLDNTTWTTYTVGGVIDFTTANSFFGANYTPASYLFAEVTEFWLDVNSGYLDWEDYLSAFASREENVPVSLGDNGEHPTGTAPDLYLPLNFASPMTDASGSGNDFDTVYNGSLLGTNYNMADVNADITLSNTNQTYDGTAKAVTVVVVPYGLTNTITYEGGSDAPTNAGSYEVIVTIANTGYYGTNTGTLTISKATPTVSAWPTASAIAVTESLTGSTLTGGTASTTGTFAFTTPDYMPDAGTYPASVTFTPTDTDNYNTTNGTVNVTVSGIANKFFKASSGTKWMVYTNGKHLIINLSP